MTDNYLSTFTKEDSAYLRSHLVRSTTGILFRRVAAVTPGRVSHVLVHDVNKGAAELAPGTLTPHPGVSITIHEVDPDVAEVTEAVWPEASVEERYTEFQVITSAHPMRSKDTNHKSFLLTEQNMSELDIFSPTGFTRNPLGIDSKGCILGYELPEQDGLLALRLAKDGTVGEWAPVSDQFLRLWTYLHYIKHPSFDVGSGRGEAKTVTRRIYNKAMSRGVLETNAFRRMTLAHHQNHIDLPFDLQGRYTTTVQENYAKAHCHIYNCIYLVAVKGVLPDQKNLPQRSSQKSLPSTATPSFESVAVNLKTWDIPQYFVHFLIQHSRAY